MRLEKVFNSQEEKLTDLVTGIEVVGCIERFIKYVTTPTSTDETLCPLEKEFINKLSLYEVFLNLKMEDLKGKSQSDLMGIIKDLYDGGYFAISERDYDDISYDLESYSDAEAYPVIKKHMEDTLNKVIEDRKKTRAEKEARERECKIKARSQDLEYHKRRIIEIGQELEKLGAGE